ncbi:hypothetical protein [Spiroplasma sp. DGKH1]|uniref:hypothetical protein n=1 Tax=Spiroplasma sp. DGKH1 TaxID=3050074 RepID=UPI0034C65604
MGRGKDFVLTISYFVNEIKNIFLCTTVLTFFALILFKLLILGYNWYKKTKTVVSYNKNYLDFKKQLRAVILFITFLFIFQNLINKSLQGDAFLFDNLILLILLVTLLINPHKNINIVLKGAKTLFWVLIIIYTNEKIFWFQHLKLINVFITFVIFMSTIFYIKASKERFFVHKIGKILIWVVILSLFNYLYEISMSYLQVVSNSSMKTVFEYCHLMLIIIPSALGFLAIFCATQTEPEISDGISADEIITTNLKIFSEQGDLLTKNFKIIGNGYMVVLNN